MGGLIVFPACSEDAGFPGVHIGKAEGALSPQLLCSAATKVDPGSYDRVGAISSLAGGAGDMRHLADTISRLRQLAESHQVATGSDGPGHLAALESFGSNPGALNGWTHVPKHLGKHAPLVVVLHGCTQSASGYDHGAGWSTLADRHGFALLFPEQRRANNGNLCFNWFEPGDIHRGQGEALSIAEMIEAMCERHGIDRSRIFITGLSAGGAMTSAMLATYPELFAGGAIIAGLPYGGATTVPQAFDRMRGHGGPTDEVLATLVEHASGHAGRWPSVAVLHGTADKTVAPSNVDRIVGQWHRLLDVPREPDRIVSLPGRQHATWSRGDGTTALETVMISGMGHGVPIDPAGTGGCGAPAPYMLDVGFSSTAWLAGFWGLAPSQPVRTTAKNSPAVAGVPERRHSAARIARETPQPVAPALNAVIEKALRAAGLMR